MNEQVSLHAMAGCNTITATTAPLLTFAVCGCCLRCGEDQTLDHEIVTCKACGAPCSCPGCVAEKTEARRGNMSA